MRLDQGDHTHTRAHQGELEAFRKAAEAAPALWRRILAEIHEAGTEGLTPDEFTDRHGLLINTVRRRFTDLWKDGKIRHHPEEAHRVNRAGNNCVVWVIGSNATDSRQKNKSAQIDELRATIARLEAENAQLRLTTPWQLSIFNVADKRLP